MFNIKSQFIKIIAFILTLFLTIKYVFSSFLIFILGKLPLKVCENIRQSNLSLKSKIVYLQKQSIQETERIKIIEQFQICDCIQSIIDSSISLCLTATLINYNSILVKLTLLISHHVHKAYVNLIFQNLIPDYSQLIQESYSHFLVWTFIVLGLFGVSTQLALIIDLIKLFTLPTKIIYRVLRLIYSQLRRFIQKIVQFTFEKDKKWITCPYPWKIKTQNLRMIALVLCIVLGQILAITIFYYAWLALIILLLIIVENFLENFYRLSLYTGKFLCILKGYRINKSSPKEKQQLLIPLFELSSILKIVEGISMYDILKKQKKQEQQNYISFSFRNIFSVFIKGREKNNEQ